MIYEKVLQTVTYFRTDVIMCQFSTFIFDEAAININVHMRTQIKFRYHFHTKLDIERQCHAST